MTTHVEPAADTDAPLFGYLVRFATPGALLSAARKVKDAGFADFDVHSPFPIHGMDEVMGIKRTFLPWLVLAAGLSGTALGFALAWFMNYYDYPFVISGKPYIALPAYIPIMFELTILLAAFMTFFGLFILNNLPLWSHPLFSVPEFARATSDGFFLSVEASDASFNEKATPEFLAGLQGEAVLPVYDRDDRPVGEEY